jgi:uncharacterized membrane protein
MGYWILFAVASALLGSISMIFKKKALKKEHANEYLLASKPLALLLLVFFIPFIDFKQSLGILAFMFLLSILTSVVLIFVARCYRNMDLSVIAPMSNFKPIFIVVLAFLLLGEHVGLKHIIGIGLLLVGTYYLESEQHAKDWLEPFRKLKSKYMVFLFFAFFLASIVAIGEKVLISSVSPFTLLFYLYLFQSIIFITFSFFVYDGWKDIKHAYKTSWKSLLGNTFFANLSNLAYFFAISMTFVSLVVPIKRLSTLFAIFLSGKFLKEDRIWHKVIACLIMLVGVFIIAL